MQSTLCQKHFAEQIGWETTSWKALLQKSIFCYNRSKN